ncbi:MAG: hypothetical protein EXR95_06170 [Gemmatimonadetes bacterium]|nr:hypothetical protein [Gemmatimonadota bacterium]
MLQNIIAGSQGMIDHILVGRFVGFAGNAAIGVSWQIFLVVIVFVSSLFTGMNVLVARFVGAGDHENADLAVYNAFLLALGLSLGVFAPIGYLVTPGLLNRWHLERRRQLPGRGERRSVGHRPRWQGRRVRCRDHRDRHHARQQPEPRQPRGQGRHLRRAAEQRELRRQNCRREQPGVRRLGRGSQVAGGSRREQGWPHRSGDLLRHAAARAGGERDRSLRHGKDYREPAVPRL